MTSSPGTERCSRSGRWRRLALLAFAGLVVLASVAAALVLDPEPTVAPRSALGSADVARAWAVLRSLDPRRQSQGLLRTLFLSERDLDLLLHEAARRWPGGRCRVGLRRAGALVTCSAEGPYGRWLNVRVDLRETSGWPEVESVRLGRLPLPRALVAPLVQQALERHPRGAEVRLVAQTVRRAAFHAGGVRVDYRWDDALSDRLLESLVPGPQQARLVHHSRAFAAALARYRADEDVPLARVLAPLFADAGSRSAAGEDPAGENRAVLLVAAFHATGQNLVLLAPALRGQAPAPPRRLTLDGREDLAQHFLVSALLALEGTTPLAQAVGMFKEQSDTFSGSGFSFNDLAADAAGTRFGELARRRPLDAQRRLAAIEGDGDLMPPWRDLPERLGPQEFRARFGGVGSTAYRNLLADIERRVAALPLLQ